MQIYHDIYVGKGIKDSRKILKKIKKNDSVPNVYCVCLEENSPHLMEIVDSYELMKEMYQFKKFMVIGIAYGKKEAFELIRTIVEEVYIKNPSLTIFKQYFFAAEEYV
jgi:hypothetical protein